VFNQHTYLQCCYGRNMSVLHLLHRACHSRLLLLVLLQLLLHLLPLLLARA
jgi:hypothetical protein